MTMQLFADLNQPASVNANQIEWLPSPLAGVDRRMLERDGDEVARATTIVRYAAGSFFSAHSHTGGEEYYVLSGVFSDESGDYPAGHYVRNPIGSSHKPFTESGCEIFVKLRQMHQDDQTYVVTDALGAAKLNIDGVTTLLLHQFESEQVMVQELNSGQRIHEYSESGLEILVLAGDVSIENKTYGSHHWFRWPGKQKIGITSLAQNTRLLVKKNHLGKSMH
jgi:hypothetical protein